MSEIKVELSGDAKSLEEASKKSIAALKKVGKGAAEAEKAFERLAKAQEKAAAITRSIIGESAGEAAQRARELVKSANEAAASTQKLGGRLSAIQGAALKGASGLAKIGGTLAGGLGVGAVVAGLGALDDALSEVLGRGIRKANEAKAAFESAAGSLLNFDLGTRTKFDVNTREQLVKLGREAQAELRAITDQLTERGVASNTGGLGGVLSSYVAKAVDGAKRVGALVSEQTNKEVLLNDALFERQATAAATLKIYQDQLRNFDAQAKLAKALADQNIATQKGLAAAASPALPGAILPGPGRKPVRFGALPAGKSEKEDPFDTLTLGILSAQKALQAGIVTKMQSLQEQTGLMGQQARILLSEGVNPLNPALQDLRNRIEANNASMEAMRASTAAQSVAFNVLGGIAQEALSGIAFRFEEANNAAAKMRNTLRGIGNRLLDIGISAGINVGIGALTGNPLSFVQALGSVAGVGALPSAAATGNTPVLSSAYSQVQRAAPQRVVVDLGVGRISGGDLLLTLQEAQNSRGNGNVSLR